MNALFKKIAQLIICLPIIGLVACGGGEASSNLGIPALAAQAVNSSNAFESKTNLFNADAQWIWGNDSSQRVNQWRLFRKNFNINGVPSSAIAKIASDTHYWLYVNGQLVVFQGGAKRGPNLNDTYYDEVDLAKYLTLGNNVIALKVWHLGKSGFSHLDSGSPGLLFDLKFNAGGQKINLSSNSSWRQIVHAAYLHETTGVQPNWRLSEWNVFYDAQKSTHLDGWNQKSFDDSRWAMAIEKGVVGAAPWNKLFPRYIPLFKFSGLNDYVNLRSSNSNGISRIVADLPSNIQVTPYIQIDAPAGLAINIKTNAYLDGGEANVRSTYITKNGLQEFESLGWMSGSKVIYEIPSGVTVRSLKYRESGYDTNFSGSFSTDNLFFNSLWNKARRTIYLNMRDTFMDTPTRERAPWWGDIAVNMLATPYMFDKNVNLLINKNIAQLIGFQEGNGVLFSPFPKHAGELPQQMLASIAVFSEYYKYSGDASALNGKTYEAIKKYLNLWKFDSNGLVLHRTGGWDWGDWGNNVDLLVLDNAWYYKALESAILLAQLTGNGQDIPNWQNQRNGILKSFDSVFWNTSIKAYRSPGHNGDTDDRANALAVSVGLAKPANYGAITQVLKDKKHASPYMETFVIEALYFMNQPEVAQERMLSRYSKEVIDAGFTLWEDWIIGGAGGGTENHGWNGAPTMLAKYGLGARPTSPAWATFELLPQLGKLKKMQALIPTPKGNLEIVLNASNPKSYQMQVRIPPNSTGRIGLPKLSTLPAIHVNGVLVYANNVSINNAVGMKYVGEDSDYIYFNTPISNNHISIFSFEFQGDAITQKTGWKHCANEGQFCSFNGFAKVSFGNGDRKVILTKSNGVNCSVSSFGSDPALGVVKECQIFVDANVPQGSMECVEEDGVCLFSGLRKVEYGAKQIFASKTLANGTSCSNAVFGDPIYGVKKACHLYPESLWTSCSQEHGECFTEESTVVRFGIQGRYLFKPVDSGLKATSTKCTSVAFGQDPALGLEKKCETSPLPPKGVWTQCAAEGSTCNFQGGRTVAYGANENYVYKFVRGSIECTNAAFGIDPAYATAKGCYFDSGRPWSPCADESGTCNTLEPVSIRFGANASYAVMDAVESTLVSTKCSNTNFGGDPALNVLKDCSYTQMPPKGGWMRCAGEGEQCSFDGVRTMAYGAKGKFVFMTVSGGASCTNTTFGADPAPQVPKECFHD